MSACKNCGTPLASDSKRNYCDDSCVDQYYGIGEWKVCPVCEGYFVKENKSQKYCGDTCRYIQKRENRKVYITKDCDNCGKSMRLEKDLKENICEECKEEILDENTDKTPLGRTGSDLFVPGVENEWHGLVNPAM